MSGARPRLRGDIEAVRLVASRVEPGMRLPEKWQRSQPELSPVEAGAGDVCWRSWLGKFAGEVGWRSWLEKLAGEVGWRSWLWLCFVLGRFHLAAF